MTKKAGAARKAVVVKEKSNDELIAAMPDAKREEALAMRERIYAKPIRPRVECVGDAIISLGTGEGGLIGSMRVHEALGTSSNEFLTTALVRIGNAVRRLGNAEADGAAVSAAVALVAAVEPQNELEATMAIQMVAANEAAMVFFERARRAEYLEHASAFSNMANKAMRSFALHAEALAKMRRNGEQVVKHVHISDGGQAVIAGTVNTGGAGVV